MPYIAHPTIPDSLGGRTARGVSYAPDGTNWVAEVDETAPGDTVIDEQTYLSATSDNVASFEVPGE